MKNTTLWVWVGVAVVVIAVAATFVWKLGTGLPTVSTTSTSTPQAQATSSLPKELLLDGMSAENITYPTSTSSGAQQVAVINASTSMQNLYYSYMQYFFHHGWGLTGVPSDNSSSAKFSAQSTSSEITVAIVPEGKGSQVTITYATK